ncbi:MAG: DCC1-like thiol-disulfide oxidoreductase family protein [Candidatus Kapaibacterium sp.]|jgi:predicted DCC family thiol-disulfide oxidoreductase YuxK|nr:DCC1-like thiol-disulfide oxidoreductase family protein [Candidatus Kapabacteria bacterium]
MRYVIYDGDCGICTQSSQMVEKLKRHDNLKILPSYNFEFDKFGINPGTAELTVIYIDSERNIVHLRTRAIMEILKNMKFPYFLIGNIFANKLVDIIFNPLYDLVAKNRAWISTKFGLNACKIPDKSD